MLTGNKRPRVGWPQTATEILRGIDFALGGKEGLPGQLMSAMG